MKNTVRLLFLGDVMCKAQMLPAFTTGDNTYDFRSLFAPVQDLFGSADFVFANMETPISCDNTELTDARFCFNSPHEFAEAAKGAGIGFVATANNHCLDRGVDGISSTVRSLDRAGLFHTGIFCEKEKKPLILNISGLRIGVLSYTYGTNAFANHAYLRKSEYWRVNLFQNQELSNPRTQKIEKKRGSFRWRMFHAFLRVFHPVNEKREPFERREFSFRCRRQLKAAIREMKKEKPDLLVMYMHTGGQYNPEATRETKKRTRFLLKAGINIVAGSHEHVVHGGDFSGIGERKLATYSLGNFDGVSGVYDQPMDKMAEYSIAWYVDVDRETKAIRGTSFSVLKTVRDGEADRKIRTVPAYDLFREAEGEEQKKLAKDIAIIVTRFSGMKIAETDIREEYVIA